MTPKTFLFVAIVALVAVILDYQNNHRELQLVKLLVRQLNLSTCPLCLGKDFCDYTQFFEIDYQRHANASNFRKDGYLLLLFTSLVQSFEPWFRRNDKIFFGNLKLQNGTVLSVVAKSAGYDHTDQFHREFVDHINTLSFIDQLHLVLNGEFPSSISHGLVVCSKADGKSSVPFIDFLNSTIDTSRKTNTMSWLESWTAAHLSADLLVLKILNGFLYAPIFYGACGQIYFVENCGLTLQYFYDQLKLYTRLQVVRELLRLAIELTDGTAHANYSFYLTDMTADNIAIRLDDKTGLLVSLKIIDWSDVIVVANGDDRLTNKNIHVSEYIECGLGCLTYSEDDICCASYSDHNVYAVCKEFLSPEKSILHEITNENQLKGKEYSEFRSIVNHCISNNIYSEFGSRLNTANILMTKIDKLLSLR